MSTFYSRTERTFSAAEVEEAFGLAETKQRDWRRRGFLGAGERGKRYEFSLTEVCILGMVNTLTASGITAGRAFNLAKFTAPFAAMQVEICQIGVDFPDETLSPEQKRATIFGLNDLDPDGRFDGVEPATIVYFPTSPTFKNPLRVGEEKPAAASLWRSLRDLEENGPSGTFSGIIFDLRAFAIGLSLHVAEPLVSYHLDEGDQ